MRMRTESVLVQAHFIFFKFVRSNWILGSKCYDQEKFSPTQENQVRGNWIYQNIIFIISGFYYVTVKLLLGICLFFIKKGGNQYSINYTDNSSCVYLSKHAVLFIYNWSESYVSERVNQS